MKTVSNHPVHILNYRNKKSISSFIPFCAFGKSFIGTKIQDFKIPVCDIFKPKEHHDQLCYETDLQLLKDSNYENLINQLELGFTLVLDYNEDRQLNSNGNLRNKSSASDETIYNNHDGNTLSIYLDTISIMLYNLSFYLRFDKPKSNSQVLSLRLTQP